MHRVDNMVIQSIALLDQLDKDINLFGMRIREWYSYHYPELFRLAPDQYKYSRLAVAILDRNKMAENENLENEILGKYYSSKCRFWVTSLISRGTSILLSSLVK